MKIEICKTTYTSVSRVHHYTWPCKTHLRPLKQETLLSEMFVLL